MNKYNNKMPTLCQLKAEAKSKGLKGYSKLNKAGLMALVNKSSSPVKATSLRNKDGAKATSLKASGTARRVKMEDTVAGKAKMASRKTSDEEYMKVFKEIRDDIRDIDNETGVESTEGYEKALRSVYSQITGDTGNQLKIKMEQILRPSAKSTKKSFSQLIEGLKKKKLLTGSILTEWNAFKGTFVSKAEAFDKKWGLGFN